MRGGAELSADDVSFIGGRSHLPADLHIDSGIDLGALLVERAPRPRGDTWHEPPEAVPPCTRPLHTHPCALHAHARHRIIIAHNFQSALLKLPLPQSLSRRSEATSHTRPLFDRGLPLLGSDEGRVSERD